MAHIFQADDLERKVASLFAAAGSLPAEAQQVAANLVLANLSGHDSHGVGMAPRYVDAILEGGLVPTRKWPPRSIRVCCWGWMVNVASARS